MAITDIGIAQSLLGKPGQISRPDRLAGSAVDRATLETTAPQLMLKKPDPQGDLARLTDSFHLNLTAFGFLAFAVGLFIVYSAIGLAFEQRRSTFRTLRSLGLSARSLTGLLLTELIMLALVAGVAGRGDWLSHRLASSSGSRRNPAGSLWCQYSGGADVAPDMVGDRTGHCGFRNAFVGRAKSLARLAYAAAGTGATACMGAGVGRCVALPGVAALALFASDARARSLGYGADRRVCHSRRPASGGSADSAGLARAVPARHAAMVERPVTAWFWADTRQQFPALRWR